MIYKNCTVLSMDIYGDNKNPFKEATINIYPNLRTKETNMQKIIKLLYFLVKNESFDIVCDDDEKI